MSYSPNQNFPSLKTYRKPRTIIPDTDYTFRILFMRLHGALQYPYCSLQQRILNKLFFIQLCTLCPVREVALDNGLIVTFTSTRQLRRFIIVMSRSMVNRSMWALRI